MEAVALHPPHINRPRRAVLNRTGYALKKGKFGWNLCYIQWEFGAGTVLSPMYTIKYRISEGLLMTKKRKMLGDVNAQ
jgi:hypothetical protein